MIELRLEEVSKSFAPGIAALDTVTFTVAPGECLALVGPSGCGKTTLLRVIAGLETPTSGLVLLDGECVNDVPCHDRGVAMFFQRPALIPQHTVRQNLAWAWTLQRPSGLVFGSGRQHDDDLLRMARLLGLDGDLDRPIQQLSGGQQQRVALGRCLLRPTKLRLLDEPLGHLDAPLRTELRRQLRTLIRETRATTIHVTHDPDEALAVGDRIAVMQHGRIVQVDVPAAIRQEPANRYVAELIHHQTGGVNFMMGEVCRDGMDTYFENPAGRWPMSVQIVDELRQSLCEGENFHPGAGKVHIMMGVAVEDVRCKTARSAEVDEVCLGVSVQELESGDEATIVIGADAAGRWIGRADLVERFERGQTVSMAFSMARAYWFDAATGRTLALPTG